MQWASFLCMAMFCLNSILPLRTSTGCLSFKELTLATLTPLLYLSFDLVSVISPTFREINLISPYGITCNIYLTLLANFYYVLALPSLQLDFKHSEDRKYILFSSFISFEMLDLLFERETFRNSVSLCCRCLFFARVHDTSHILMLLINTLFVVGRSWNHESEFWTVCIIPMVHANQACSLSEFQLNNYLFSEVNKVLIPHWAPKLWPPNGCEPT